MTSHTGKFTGAIIGLAVLAVVAGIFVWSGLYNIGADDPHFRTTYAILETLRDRSIETRASTLDVPDLSDPEKITQGAGNYNAMCSGCHLSPGMTESELSKGLYPAPPNLAKEKINPAHAFWVIKHGIKASGMPAWGKSMADDYIWNMAAFLQKLPMLDADQYKEMVAHSGGHSHGGGETGGHEHSHAEGDEHHHDEDGHDGAAMDDHDDDHTEHHHSAEVDSAGSDAAHTSSDSREHAEHAAAASGQAGEAKVMTHRHADGTVESHPVKAADSASDTHKHND